MLKMTQTMRIMKESDEAPDVVVWIVTLVVASRGIVGLVVGWSF